MTNWVGWKLADYHLAEVLRQGELATIYRAQNEVSGLKAVVQVINPQLEIDKAHFMTWGDAAAHLHHPHLTPILAYGWHQDTGYWVRPQNNGLSLATLLQQLETGHYRLAISESLHLISQLTAALDYLHQQNEVHGAIHPGNIWLCPAAAADKPDWSAALQDNGLWALLAGRQPNLLTIFTALWPYAAPEQTEGFTPSPASDLYNLTGILFHLLTGRPPFRSHSLEETRYLHNEIIPSIPDTSRRILPQRLIAILRKGLAKQPTQRLQSAAHLAVAVQQLLDSGLLPGGEAIYNWLNGQLPRPIQAPGPAELVIRRDQETPQVVLMDKPVLTLGRSRKNDICMPEQGVSRHHARLEWLPNGWHLVDLDSTNGVWVGENTLRPQEPYPWHANETAQLGGYTIHWQPVLPGNHQTPVVPLPPPPASEIPLATAPRRFEETFAFAFAHQTEVATGPPQPTSTPIFVTNEAEAQLTPLDTPSLETTLITMLPEVEHTGEPERADVVPIVEAATPPEAMTIPPLIEPMTPVAPLPVPLVRLTLIPNEIKLMPGREAFFQVVVANQGQSAERFYLRVEGLPPDWVSIPENQLFLEAGEQDILQINVLNTLEKNIEPGQRTFIVRVSPETAPDIVSAVTGYVQIEPCISFYAELKPERVRPHTSCMVQIHNSGNVTTTFSILSRTETENETVQFAGQSEQLTLIPGQTGHLPLTIKTTTRPLWGKQKTIPFRVQVRASHGDSQIKVGQLDIIPIFPIWLLLTTGFICLLLTLLLIFLPN